MTKNKTPITYKDSGVDIDAGNVLVERIKSITTKTYRSEVVGGIGGFGAAFEIPERYKKPVLISGTDGVGTKLKLAFDLNRHETIGIDLVAMCVNDIIVSGAEPLFFLDYYATGKLEVDVAEKVIKGISNGCVLAGCALSGGETAEMPDMYRQGEYDLAGFCVGVVEKEKILGAHKVQEGDVLIALSSSGIHSNGYSLIRRILQDMEPDTLTKEIIKGEVLADILMEPTKIYVRSILELLNSIPVHALCHITGGGFQENIPRVLQDDQQVIVDRSSWSLPPIFKWIQDKTCLSDYELLRTFNGGVGFVVVLPEKYASHAIDLLEKQGESSWKIGRVCRNKGIAQESVIFSS